MKIRIYAATLTTIALATAARADPATPPQAPFSAVPGLTEPPMTDKERALWQPLSEAMEKWQVRCLESAAWGKTGTAASCAKPLNEWLKAAPAWPVAVRVRLRVEQWLPFAAREPLLSKAHWPVPALWNVGQLVQALGMDVPPRSLARGAVWAMQELERKGPRLLAAAGPDEAAHKLVLAALVDAANASQVVVLCTAEPIDRVACGGAWCQWLPPRDGMDDPAFAREAAGQNATALGEVLDRPGTNGFSPLARAIEMVQRYPYLKNAPAAIRLARRGLAALLTPDEEQATSWFVYAVGVHRALYTQLPGEGPREFRWAQRRPPPPDPWPIPLASEPTPSIAAPPVGAKLAKALAQARKEFARRQRKYAGCGYEAGGFMGGMECESWSGPDKVEPRLAAYLLDAELFAKGGRVTPKTCADGHSHTWSLDQLYLDELVDVAPRELVLNLLAVRAEAWLRAQKPGVAPTAAVVEQGQALIGNFVVVSQTPLCQRREPDAAATSECLAVWLRWTARHATDTPEQAKAHRDLVAQALASRSDAESWRQLVLGDARVACLEPTPPAWYWAARNLTLDPAGPPDWSDIDEFTLLNEHRAMLYPPSAFGLTAPDLLAAPMGR